ncbi:ech hydrogenase subunit F [Desulfobaculum xiamenense]|uniref:Ech hydrogenase subunit F n=1 Tax=Desulfobaculum xiamenense TaxID=995050 RepID=A0A846QNZ2_9BACT|nr:4Fe-4S dicluster domain-containing protein [Desulfobaculum xiamenense]NJB68003.1 ech hydrogenase subunit F [Desulfobaculum xiamenense]
MLNLTPTVLKNLFTRKATRLYPFEVRPTFEKYRGELVNNIETCIFCGMCSRKCPSQCISVDRKAGTWDLDPYACIGCGICVSNCPAKSLSMKNDHKKPVATKVMIKLQGTPPKPAKKASEKAEEKDFPVEETKVQ